MIGAVSGEGAVLITAPFTLDNPGHGATMGMVRSMETDPYRPAGGQGGWDGMKIGNGRFKSQSGDIIRNY